MSVTDYIPAEKLSAEGFIHTSDTDAVMRVVFGTVPRMLDVRLKAWEIARWIGVPAPRFRRYVEDRHRAGLMVLDPDGCLSLRQIRQMDWSLLTEQGRTTRISGSNFQGRKRKPQTLTRS